MTIAWEAVYGHAELLCPEAPLRVANLLIAAACHRGAQVAPRSRWNGTVARTEVKRLALDPLAPLNEDPQLWRRAAELALDAAYLGTNPEGMHSWAASFQRASATQKSLGAYATHDAFALALARITMDPLSRRRTYRIVDPSVGAGNLLLAAIEHCVRHSTASHLRRFINALHGVELDPRARELCCLLLWLVGAESGVSLRDVANKIRVDNALTRDWWSQGDLFDVLLMNPPWESLRHSVVGDGERERIATVERMSVQRAGSPGLPPLYSAQGTGDRNLFKAFVELVPHLLVEGGRLGALVPAAFASDAGMTELRERYLSQFEIARWTSYENRGGYFPIDSRYKFGLLAATRSNEGTRQLSVRSFAVEPSEVDAPHIALSREDIALIGGKYHIIPELFDPRELDVLRLALSHGSKLFLPGPLGCVRYRREVDLSLGKAEFQHVTEERLVRLPDGTFRNARGTVFTPLLEGRLVGAYDCFQKSWIAGSGRTAKWEENGSRALQQCTPQYVIEAQEGLPPRVAICDVTASTNTRTVIATLVPHTWRCGNTAPVLEFENELFAYAGLGILNSMVFDWIARRLVSGLHLNKFILEGLVWPRLTRAALRTIATAAWSICANRPRSGVDARALHSPPWQNVAARRRPMSQVSALSSIEVLVAEAFGLTEQHLATIFDNDPSNRRGFWRYLATNPEAELVIGAAIERFRRRA